MAKLHYPLRPGKKKPRDYQVALLENNLDDDTMRIYEGFHFDTTYEERTTAEILAKLEAYAVGEENETYFFYYLFFYVQR